MVGAGNAAGPVSDGCLGERQHGQRGHSSGGERKGKAILVGDGRCVSRRADLVAAAEVEVEAEKGPSEGGSQGDWGKQGWAGGAEEMIVMGGGQPRKQESPRLGNYMWSR